MGQFDQWAKSSSCQKGVTCKGKGFRRDRHQQGAIELDVKAGSNFPNWGRSLKGFPTIADSFNDILNESAVYLHYQYSFFPHDKPVLKRGASQGAAIELKVKAGSNFQNWGRSPPGFPTNYCACYKRHLECKDQRLKMIFVLFVRFQDFKWQMSSLVFLLLTPASKWGPREVYGRSFIKRRLEFFV